MQPRNPAYASGVDVSSNNGAVDFSAVKVAGHSLALIKALEGATYHDPTFVPKYKAAKAAGLVEGSYCFARPRTSSALAEANEYVDTVLRAGGFFGFPPVLDMEDHGALSPSALADWILAWEARVKARTGRQPVLYTYTSFIVEHLAPVVWKLAHMPLWIADYSGCVPSVPGWSTWTMLQHTERGVIPGHAGHFDLNEFAGTVDDLHRFCGINQGGSFMNADQVKQLQSNLKRILKLPDSFTVDGQYGPATTAAVKSFQTIYKAGPADGVAGLVTANAIQDQIKKLDAAAKPVQSAPSPAPALVPSPPLVTPPVNSNPNGDPNALTAVQSAQIAEAKAYLAKAVDILSKIAN